MQQKISLIIIDFKNITPPTAPPLFVNALCLQMNRANAIERIKIQQHGAALPHRLHHHQSKAQKKRESPGKRDSASS
jgi:hypothetical protein